MKTRIKKKVPYTVSNIKRCRCPQCFVQANSKCVKEKYSGLKNELESLEEIEALEPQKVPGIYCSTGIATCKDLDFNKQCICYTCPVWDSYELENSKTIIYFCNKGEA